MARHVSGVSADAAPAPCISSPRRLNEPATSAPRPPLAAPPPPTRPRPPSAAATPGCFDVSPRRRSLPKLPLSARRARRPLSSPLPTATANRRLPLRHVLATLHVDPKPCRSPTATTTDDARAEPSAAQPRVAIGTTREGDYFVTNVDPLSSVFGVLQVGDMLMAVDGQPVGTMSHAALTRYLGRRHPPAIELQASRLDLHGLFNTGCPTAGPLLRLDLHKRPGGLGIALVGSCADGYGALFCREATDPETSSGGGIEAGDRLLAINGAGCVSLSLRQARAVLDGLPPGPFHVLVLRLGRDRWARLQREVAEATSTPTSSGSSSSAGSSASVLLVRSPNASPPSPAPLALSDASGSSGGSSESLLASPPQTPPLQRRRRRRRVSFSLSCGRGLRKLHLPCPVAGGVTATLGRPVVVDVVQQAGSVGLGFKTAAVQGPDFLAVFVASIRPSAHGAALGALQVGDRILEVHGRCVATLDRPAFTRLLRGSDTHVKLVVQRLGAAQWRDLREGLIAPGPGLAPSWERRLSDLDLAGATATLV